MSEDQPDKPNTGDDWQRRTVEMADIAARQQVELEHLEARLAGAVATERARIVERIREMARVTLPDDVSRTALTIEKVAAVLIREGQ